MSARPHYEIRPHERGRVVTCSHPAHPAAQRIVRNVAESIAADFGLVPVELGPGVMLVELNEVPGLVPLAGLVDGFGERA